MPNQTPPRRQFLRMLGMPAALALGLSPDAAAQTQALPPTPSCAAAAPTPRQTEGPYFKPASPPRTSLVERGMTATKIVITGLVLTTECKPVARALIDVWQADDKGEYDNVGFTLRGHQFTDEGGRYRLETIVPGLYPGRTRHIHLKVQAPGRPVLTTQLYFPGESQNQRDGLFSQALVLSVRETTDGKVATFDFVLRG
jgi:protocatechuate 3,4-dioxygenase beta subunit